RRPPYVITLTPAEARKRTTHFAEVDSDAKRFWRGDPKRQRGRVSIRNMPHPLFPSRLSSIASIHPVWTMERGSDRGKRESPASTPPPPPGGAGSRREEEEVDKFYALLEKIRAIRESVRTSRFKRMKTEAAPVWRPKFELEDFMDGGEAGSATVGERSQQKAGRKEEEEENDDEKKSSLDLCLSL
ncbi:hypothetical protein BHM03_00040468, partial [Ensete ventricosum]